MVVEPKDILELEVYADFLADRVKKLGDLLGEEVHPEKVLKAIRKYIGIREFGIFFVSKEEGKPKGFLVLVQTENLYEEKECLVWLMWMDAGAPTKELEEVMIEWCDSRGIKKVYATNMTFTKAKRRWLQRHGFSFFVESYRRVL